MSYITLYRKYRPKNFNNMVGQYIIVKTLKNAIKYKKIHHCFLLSGDKGVGKTTLAKILAKSINCFCFEKEEDCCNNCESCSMIDNRNSLDIIEIDGASYNGVDEIRELKNKAQYKPSILRYKVYIIDEVHVLSNNAFNALLKLLEDPPVSIVFILITSELRKIPKTIISRSQHFHLKNLSILDIKKRLNYIVNQEKILIDENSLDTISFYSNGSLRDALNLLDQINSFKNNGCYITRKDIEEVLGIIPKKKIEFLLKCFFKNTTKDIIFFVEELFQLSNINIYLFVSDLIDLCQVRLIDFFKKNDDIDNLFYYLSNNKRENFFKILFKLQENLIHSRQKENLIKISFLEISQLFMVDNKFLFEKDNFNDKKENKIFLPSIIYKNFFIKDNIIIYEKHKTNKIHLESTKKTDIFVKCLKKIFLYSDENTKNIIKKRWYKLKQFPKKELSIAANILYKTDLLIISSQKEMLLSCNNENEYKRLLNRCIRDKIKLILNSKKEFIKEYFVVLKKDWEEFLYPIYKQFLKTKILKDSDFYYFDTHFYEQNSVLNIEQNKEILVSLARELFGFEKVEVINTDLVKE